MKQSIYSNIFLTHASVIHRWAKEMYMESALGDDEIQQESQTYINN